MARGAPMTMARIGLPSTDGPIDSTYSTKEGFSVASCDMYSSMTSFEQHHTHTPPCKIRHMRALCTLHGRAWMYGGYISGYVTENAD